MTESGSETSGTPTNDPIVAKAGRYYRNTRYIMVVVFILYGIWSIRDGFYAWPKANAEAIEKARQEAVAKGLDPDKVVDPENVPHPGWDIPFNQVIGIVLPPLAIIFLIWILYNSRGEYRLEGTTLSVPGHPPVPFENVTEIDKRLWDKKGIAYISYDLGNGRRGKFKLDDFVYDAQPTDEIYKRLNDYVAPAGTSEPPASSTENDSKEEAHG